MQGLCIEQPSVRKTIIDMKCVQHLSNKFMVTLTIKKQDRVRKRGGNVDTFEKYGKKLAMYFIVHRK